MGKKYVYMFSEGNASMRNLLGGKGANLAEMTVMGLPIPQGFTVTTEACTEYNEGGKVLSDEVVAQIEEALKKLEAIAGKTLGDNENPLLVSVRSGARASMPGMMDTVLNLGLNDVSVQGLAKATDNPRFAYDSYRRFIMMFADVVIGVSKSKFERKLDEYKEKVGAQYDTDLTAENLKEVVDIFKQKQQFDLIEEKDFYFKLAQKIVSAKIHNQLVLLRRYNRNIKSEKVHELINYLANTQKNIKYTSDNNELLGYEGLASRTYFSALGMLINKPFQFTKRTKQPPRDPFNTMLSMGYSILFNEILSNIIAIGLHPYIGFFHQLAKGHPALVSDLIEEWRAVIVDALLTYSPCLKAGDSWIQTILAY